MSDIKKRLKQKISPIIFFSTLIIFVILVSLAFVNIFYVKSDFSQTLYPSKSIEGINKQETVKLPVKKVASESAKKAVPQVYIPPASGNQLIVPVLYYHYVGNNPNAADLQRNALSISPDKFEQQMKYLTDNGFTAISYDTLYAAFRKQATLPSKPVILTFDDGYIDFYYNAYNILRQYNLSATVFVPTGLVGQPSYLTWDMIREMHSSGLINFGTHSVHHYHLASLSSEAAFAELADSKKVLQDALGIPINYMAYPYGETNSAVVSLVQKAGYIGAIGTWSGKVQSEGTIYSSPRLRISGSIELTSFASLLQ